MATAKSPTIAEHFSALTDLRRACLVRYELRDIIVLTICAVISGADDWVAVAEYGKRKRTWLRRFLNLPNKTPSHDTLPDRAAYGRASRSCR